MRIQGIRNSILFCISILLLVVPTLPHHHHAAAICVEIGQHSLHSDASCCTHEDEQACTTDPGHPHTHTCQEECLTHLYSLHSPSAFKLQTKLAWVALPWAMPAVAFSSLPTEHLSLFYNTHRVPLPSSIPLGIGGLRAPPALG